MVTEPVTKPNWYPPMYAPPILHRCLIPLLSHIHARRPATLIEQAFRDLKSQRYGEGPERSRLRSAGRFTVLVLIASLAAFLLWLLGTAAMHQEQDRHLRPGSRTRNAYSRLLLARLLLTLDSCLDLIKDLVTVVVGADQWGSSHHAALFAEPGPATCRVRLTPGVSLRLPGQPGFPYGASFAPYPPDI